MVPLLMAISAVPWWSAMRVLTPEAPVVVRVAMVLPAKV